MRELIYAHAIRNAATHGTADSKAVLSKLLGEKPELRSNARHVLKEVEGVVKEVNTLSAEEIEREFKRFTFVKKERVEKGLAPLSDVEKGNVLLRFAPNPSGPLHLGHARAAILNDEYAKFYDGKLILRFEDTDPKRVDMDAYDMIKKDLNWLGVEWDEEVFQSDRLEVYIKRARQLIIKKAAYVCTCPQETFKKLRESAHPCLCRNEKDTLDEFENMFSKYHEGAAVLRLKTDLNYRNVSIRDFPIMRIVEKKHPRVGDKKVYPLMNFSVPIDDFELGLTHILRGKDHILNTHKQAFIYDYFGWEQPHYVHYGLLKIIDAVLSTSDIKTNIVAGNYSGWNDERLGTLAAIERRGIKPEAVRRVMLDVGTKSTDITFSWKNLYAYNKDIIDAEADRYSFVDLTADIPDKETGGKSDPFTVRVVNTKAITAVNRLHPTIDRGERRVKLNPDMQEFLISKQDFEKLYRDDTIRLMGAYNVKITSIEGETAEAEYISDSLEEARSVKARLVNWVKISDNVSVKVYTPEGHHMGFAEADLRNAEVGDVVQFERFGFVRIDKTNKKSGVEIEAVFAHK